MTLRPDLPPPIKYKDAPPHVRAGMRAFARVARKLRAAEKLEADLKRLRSRSRA